MCSRKKEDDEFEYIVFSDGDVWIEKYKGTKERVTIPATLDGLPIREINVSAFSDKSELTTVMLPSNIETINSLAFANCTNLREINFPDKLRIIHMFAFSGCISLTSIVLPDSLKVVWNYAFDECINLTSITMPPSLDKVYRNSFPRTKKPTMIVQRNSPMEEWVKEKKIRYIYAGQNANAL